MFCRRRVYFFAKESMLSTGFFMRPTRTAKQDGCQSNVDQQRYAAQTEGRIGPVLAQCGPVFRTNRSRLGQSQKINTHIHVLSASANDETQI